MKDAASPHARLDPSSVEASSPAGSDDSGVDLVAWQDLLSCWGRSDIDRDGFENESGAGHLASLRAELVAEDAESFIPPVEPLGDFDIIREIGRGGMGIVYEALQISVTRRVALKVLPSSEWLDSRRIRRFNAEARVAAVLHHTNIVPVFSQGQQRGVHYMAMQFIDGVSLDQLIASERASGSDESRGPDAPGRSIDQSTELAIADIGRQVAVALEYAHGQGVLHRDIKPGNLLLDQKGTVWLSDFGLAKARHIDDLTETGAVVGTRRYMAPECFQHEADIRSDVYSLGATLYELVSHQPAFDAGEMPWERRIRPLSEIAPGVSRDLVTIITKALDRDPARRYQTAGALADDLDRLIRGEPIHARRTRWWERTSRWCHRNPALAGLTGLVASLLVVLAVGSVITAEHFRREAIRTRGLIRAREVALRAGQEGFKRELAAQSEASEARFLTREIKQRADQDARRAETLTSFLVSDMIRELWPERRQGRPLTVRSFLDHAAVRVEQVFVDQPRTAATIQQSLGESFSVIGRYAEAVEQLQRSVNHRVEELGSDHPDTLTATSLLANALAQRGQFKRAMPLHRAAYEGLRNNGEADDRSVLMARHNLGLCLMKMGRYAEAYVHFEQIVVDRGPGSRPGQANSLRAMNNLALCLKHLGRIDEALPISQQILDTRQKTLGEAHPDTLSAMHNHAQLLGLKKQHVAAQELYERTLDVKRKTLGAEHPVTLNTLHNLANCHSRQGRYEESARLNQQVLEIRRRVLASNHPSTLKTQSNLGRTLFKLRRLADAERELRAAWQSQTSVRGEHHVDTILTLHALGRCLDAMGEHVEAGELLADVLAARRRKLGNRHRTTLWTLRTVVANLVQQQHWEEAELLAEESVRLHRDVYHGNSHQLASTLVTYSRVLLSNGHHPQAETRLHEAIAIDRRKPSRCCSLRKTAASLLARCSGVTSPAS